MRVRSRRALSLCALLSCVSLHVLCAGRGMCACELNCPRAAKVIMWKTCKIKISLSLSLSLSLGSVSGMNTGQSVLSRPQTAMPNRRAAQLAVLRLFLGVPIQDLSAPRAPPPQAAVAPGMADPLMMRQLEELSSENADLKAIFTGREAEYLTAIQKLEIAQAAAEVHVQAELQLALAQEEEEEEGGRFIQS